MKLSIVCPFLLLLCLATSNMNAQTLALFRAVENGAAKMYDSTTHAFLHYNTADTIITNRHFERVQALPPIEYRQAAIGIKLSEEGRRRFAEATSQSIGKQILIILGDRLLSAPTVVSEVKGGKLEITGGYTYEEVKVLANKLQQKEQKGSVVPLDNVKAAISKLDVALVRKDYKVLDELLSESLLMGHSNAYFQTKDEVIRDLKRAKITYDKIEQLSIQEQNQQRGFCRVNRIITVTGKYEGTEFSMKLAVMEIWVDDHDGPQLWSRQAVKIKE